MWPIYILISPSRPAYWQPKYLSLNHIEYGVTSVSGPSERGKCGVIRKSPAISFLFRPETDQTNEHLPTYYRGCLARLHSFTLRSG